MPVGGPLAESKRHGRAAPQLLDSFGSYSEAMVTAGGLLVPRAILSIRKVTSTMIPGLTAAAVLLASIR
ncbi:hypothetical protein SM0020_00600 [Sinorhizobium meliloti CCNWSX0020]|uniref:Uncharacterized protein n=1 Tax=Sinorhizobium meliloti CCNWSX0020 TaxID=1107881 RepID=H0FSK9_RHIML|nr:hypothetical protein SM0020_00600 [Sinorhizobium meliloti CCNWSX0020]